MLSWLHVYVSPCQHFLLPLQCELNSGQSLPDSPCVVTSTIIHSLIQQCRGIQVCRIENKKYHIRYIKVYPNKNLFSRNLWFNYTDYQVYTCQVQQTVENETLKRVKGPWEAKKVEYHCQRQAELPKRLRGFRSKQVQIPELPFTNSGLACSNVSWLSAI